MHSAAQTAHVWVRTNVSLLLVMLVSYEFERHELQIFLNSKILYHTYDAKVPLTLTLNPDPDPDPT